MRTARLVPVLVLAAAPLLGACLPDRGTPPTLGEAVLEADPATVSVGFVPGGGGGTIGDGTTITNVGDAPSAPLDVDASSGWGASGCQGVVLDPDESCFIGVTYLGDPPVVETGTLTVSGGADDLVVPLQSFELED